MWREEKEYKIANLNGHLVPLKKIVDRMNELEPYKNDLVVVHCRSGGRGIQATKFLQATGFTNVRNPARRHPRLEQRNRSVGARLLGLWHLIWQALQSQS